MDQHDNEPAGGGTGGSANTPPFGQEPRTEASEGESPRPGQSGMGAAGSAPGLPTQAPVGAGGESGVARGTGGLSGSGGPGLGRGTAERGTRAGTAGGTGAFGDPPHGEEQEALAPIGSSRGGEWETGGRTSGRGGAGGRGPMEDVRNRAESQINQGLRQAAGRLEDAAQALDSFADSRTRGATGARARAGDMAHSVADTMESVARYFRDNDAEGLRSDLERQVRQRPLQTLLIGLGAGWLTGKILR